MSRLAQLYQKPKYRMRAIIVTLAILAASAVLFIIYENNMIQSSYLSVYENRQDNYTNQLSYQLVSLLDGGKTTSEVVDYFAEYAEVSGNSWMYITMDDTVIFAKNKSTTASLLKEKKKEVLIKRLEEQDAILTSKDVERNEKKYSVGVVTDVNYALSQGNILQQQIYNTLFVALLGMLSIMALIGITAKLNRIENQLSDTQEQLKRQNIKLEQSTETAATAEVYESQPEIEEKEYYDEELIRLFLKKSDDLALMPMQILFADIVMEERYYSKKEIFLVMNTIKSLLKKNHVIGELKKGSFVVLMYKTQYAEAQELLQRAQSKLEQLSADNSFQMNMRVLEVETGTPAIEVFERGI